MSDSYSYYTGESYNKYSYLQAVALSKANHLIQYSTGSLECSGTCFTICDYGCSDGYNSFEIVKSVIGSLRMKHGSKLAIEVLFEDLPSNDFNSLFQAVEDNGLFKDVFLSAVPTSFFLQVVQDGRVNLAFSSASFHWLPTSPCRLRNSLLGQLSDNKKERSAWKTAAAEFWETILLKRASEMAAGAVACFMVPGIKDDNKNSRGIFGNFEAMSNIYKGMISDGLVTQEEYDRTTINIYMRSEEEFLKPLMAGAPVYEAGLRLTLFSWIFASEEEHDHIRRISQTSGNQPRSDLADRLVLAHRVFTNHSFRSALADSRSDAEKTWLVDQFYSRYREKIQSDQKNYFFEVPFIFLELKKL